MHIFYPEYSWDPKYGNRLGNSLPFSPAQRKKLHKVFGLAATKEYMLCVLFLHKVFPGILQLTISNGNVIAVAVGLVNPSSPYWGQTPKAGKEGFGVRNSQFPRAQGKGRFWSKSPFSLCCPGEKYGFLTRNALFWGARRNGSFFTP